jgi:hypothetical protein
MDGVPLYAVTSGVLSLCQDLSFYYYLDKISSFLLRHLAIGLSLRRRGFDPRLFLVSL